jgi:hypothetical protein
MKAVFRGVRYLAVVLVLLAAIGCAEDRYFYVPSALEERVDQQSGAAYYPVPANTPKGNARVQSMGIVDLEARDSGRKTTALHLRLSVSNQDQVPWSVNVQEQIVNFPNQGGAEPILANSDSNRLPVITVQPHELRTVDLYYPLPPGAKDAGQIPEFDFRWQVHVGHELVARTTGFARWKMPDYYAYPYPYDPYWSFGWGGWWWGAPPGASFHYRA